MTRKELHDWLYFGLSEKKGLGIIQKILDDSGVKHNYIADTERSMVGYFEILSDDGKVIGGATAGSTFPEIMLHKRKLKYVKRIESNENVTPPIPGTHRILEWHDVKNKRHVLAGGEVILHVVRTEVTEEEIDETIEDLISKGITLDK